MGRGKQAVTRRGPLARELHRLRPDVLARRVTRGWVRHSLQHIGKATVVSAAIATGTVAVTHAHQTPSTAAPTDRGVAAQGLPSGDPTSPVPGPGTCHLGDRNGQPVPDPACTPGAVNPAVTQATSGQTICVAGWTKTVRPPTSVTDPLKRRLAVAYAMPPVGELDHLVSLELGGAPDDPRNLWVEPGTIPNAKDRVENWLKREVCAGRMALATAQAGIATDWTQYLPAATGTPENEEN